MARFLGLLLHSVIYEENQSQAKRWLEEGGAFVKILFFYFTPRLNQWQFLQGQLLPSSEPISVNFSCSGTLTSVGLPSPLNGSLTHTQFCNVLYWWFENNGSLGYPPLPVIGTFHYVVSKNLLSALSSSGKSLSVERPSNSWWQIQVFQNCNFCLKSWILSLAANTVSYFFLDRLTLFIF